MKFRRSRNVALFAIGFVAMQGIFNYAESDQGKTYSLASATAAERSQLTAVVKADAEKLAMQGDIRVDRHTVIVGVAYMTGAIRYTVEIDTKLLASDHDIDLSDQDNRRILADEMGRLMRRGVCTTPQLNVMVNAGIIDMHYAFHDETYAHLGLIEITDCAGYPELVYTKGGMTLTK